ncbi:MAG: hypothetical protein Q8P46_02050 [Hyphomicrobiales bacterium]|nr:hypothetical protein [Hyphomicrobiales bacterium]
MSQGREERESERRRAALRDLERAGEQSEVVFSSSVKRVVARAWDHFTAADADSTERIEVWGRRIGRALSLIAVLVLAYYLAVTYL